MKRSLNSQQPFLLFASVCLTEQIIGRIVCQRWCANRIFERNGFCSEPCITKKGVNFLSSKLLTQRNRIRPQRNKAFAHREEKHQQVTTDISTSTQMVEMKVMLKTLSGVTGLQNSFSASWHDFFKPLKFYWRYKHNSS